MDGFVIPSLVWFRLQLTLSRMLYFLMDVPCRRRHRRRAKGVVTHLMLWMLPSQLCRSWGVWDKRNPGGVRPRLFTVGRLHVATSGLLLVTNDKERGQVVGCRYDSRTYQLEQHLRMP